MAEPGECPATQPVGQDEAQATQPLVHPETELLEDVQATQLVATQIIDVQLLATELNDVEQTQLLDFVQATQWVDAVPATQVLGSPTTDKAILGQEDDQERSQIVGQAVEPRIDFDVGTQIGWQGGKVTEATHQVPVDQTLAAATQIGSRFDQARDDEIAAVATQVQVDAQAAAQVEGSCGEDQVGADEIATQVQGSYGEDQVGADEIGTQVQGSCGGDQVGADEIGTQVQGSCGEDQVGADEIGTQVQGSCGEDQVGADEIGTQVQGSCGEDQVGADEIGTQVQGSCGEDQVGADEIGTQVQGSCGEDQVGADEIGTQVSKGASQVGAEDNIYQVEVEGNRDQGFASQFGLGGNREGLSAATGRRSDKKTKNWASVRAESFRNSALKAYERLKAGTDARPDEPLAASAKLLLSWGDKQGFRSNQGASTAGDDVAEIRETSFVDDSGGTSCSAALTPTPVTQPSGNLLAMWSNNKKSTTSKTSAASPSKEAHENSLGKVKKVLFAGREKDLDFAPRCQNIIVATAFHEAGKELSYLNSQEPGEESQRNALDAVDKFLFLSTTGSQSQGDIADAASFDIPADNDPPIATTMPQVLSHAEALKMEAAAAYAWMDSQGNPAPESPPPPDVPKKQEKKDLATLDEPPEKPPETRSQVTPEKPSETRPQVTPENPEKPPETRSPEKPPETRSEVTPDKPPETRSQVTSSRRNLMVTKRVFLTDQAKRGRKRGSAEGLAATPEAAAPEDMPGGKIPSGRATTTRSNRKRKGSFARASPDPDYTSPVLTYTRSARKRREEEQRQILTSDSQRRCKRRPVKILFSHSLDKEVVEQQKKIMKKLNLQSATNSAEFTHFVTDKFLRTVNMLEALAVGKPVVTAAWLENCRLAGCLLDEKNFILEDAKKEKEYGFSMRTTFSAAQHKLLFQGLRLYLTPKVKPPELRSIIEAAGGQVLETFDCSNHDCLIVSCEEDHALCVPILDKGISVYSAEFLLSGIVSYHLDFSKNQLFVDYKPSE